MHKPQKPKPQADASPDWDALSLDVFYYAVNDPSKRPTPQATVEAVMYSVRTRGVKALKEPATIERLSRCDAAALAQIKARIKKMGGAP